jgi:hypothetical protein
MWQLAQYRAEEQKQLAECWWPNELGIGRALRVLTGIDRSATPLRSLSEQPLLR